ncbi:deoxyribonuclease V [Pedobacter sp. UYP30]|uniref:endonuclease V n=1 Tax=Pedobacter sp. UYP30 TaxID=1756400 RepID=UPI0033918419
MKLAVDVYYYNTKAKVCGIIFKDWEQQDIEKIISLTLSNDNEYISGEFFKRELPCILKLLEKVDIQKIDTIIIDGYVYLNDQKKLGLGGYLYHSLEEKIPIIGVAKSSFFQNDQNVVKVLRSNSKKPLYITAIGIDKDVAANYVESMFGLYRFPELLRKLDQETKNLFS